MKKMLFLVLLLFPITVFAKTPNLDETLKVIDDISNVSVSEDTKIISTDIKDNNIIFNINSNEVKINYTFDNNKFSFTGGIVTLDDNKKVIDITDNQYAFYLYSILENKSAIPYDPNNYYNNETIKEKINSGFYTSYKEDTNTFGITLKDLGNNKYNIIYDYYVDGDYPVIELEQVSSDFTNPATGNYNLLITIMLISVLCIGVYTYFDPKKSN